MKVRIIWQSGEATTIFNQVESVEVSVGDIIIRKQGKEMQFKESEIFSLVVE